MKSMNFRFNPELFKDSVSLISFKTSESLNVDCVVDKWNNRFIIDTNTKEIMHAENLSAIYDAINRDSLIILPSFCSNNVDMTNFNHNVYRRKSVNHWYEYGKEIPDEDTNKNKRILLSHADDSFLKIDTAKQELFI